VINAGDDLVCDECLNIADDNPYTLDEALDLIPAHPQCRCSVTPWYDRRYGPREPYGDAAEKVGDDDDHSNID
jgi:hypothetical protein